MDATRAGGLEAGPSTAQLKVLARLLDAQERALLPPASPAGGNGFGGNGTGAAGAIGTATVTQVRLTANTNTLLCTANRWRRGLCMIATTGSISFSPNRITSANQGIVRSLNQLVEYHWPAASAAVICQWFAFTTFATDIVSVAEFF